MPRDLFGGVTGWFKRLIARKVVVVVLGVVAGWLATQLDLPKEQIESVLLATVAVTATYLARDWAKDFFRKDLPDKVDELPTWLWKKYTDGGFLATVVAQYSPVLATKLGLSPEVVSDMVWMLVAALASVLGADVGKEYLAKCKRGA